MKAKVLAGSIGSILLTASVVVGFLHHAAFIAQKSDHRGRRHSVSQIVASAGKSGADDLSSLLQTAKVEMGANTASSANSASDTVTSAARSVAKAATSVTTAVDDGKAPTLANFVKGSIDGSAPRAASNSDWSSTKSGLSLLKDNTIRLTGADPATVPGIKLPSVSAPDFSKFTPKVSLKDLENIDFKGSIPKFSLSEIDWPKSYDVASIQQFIEHLPPAAKTYAAVAAGATILFIGSANSKSNSKPKGKAASSVNIDLTSRKIGGLTDQLGTLQSRMKALEATGFDLDSQLKDAKEKLTQKELDISKAKLEAADASLSLNREIDLLKQRLQENDEKAKQMDVQLKKARNECIGLVNELEKNKKTTGKKVASEAAKLERLKKEAAAAAKAAKEKEAAETRKMALEAAKKVDEEAIKKKKEAAAKKVTPPAPKKAATKKAAPKKAATKKAAPKKAVTKAKSEELPTADSAAPKQAAAPKKKVVKKTVSSKAKTTEAVKKAAPKKKADKKDLMTLTKSALSRTTVKVIVEYLESKGIKTTDSAGKTMIKANLIKEIDALRS